MGRSARDDQAPVRIGAHKFFAPPAYAGSLQREAILSRVFTAQPEPIVLVQAPAGHGKSTLLQQIKSACEADGARTAWLSFDDADNDARRFFGLLQALLEALEQDADADPGPAGARDLRTLRAEAFLSRLATLASDTKPVVLLFDEFQVLSERSINAFFRDVVGRVPAGVRIVIGSRTVPKIGLSRLVVNNQALVLRADDLRFSRSEVAQLFSGEGLQALDERESDVVYRQTEGWPAALQLYRLALRSSSLRANLLADKPAQPRQLAEYLADNVLAMQPEDVQTFLLQTSLLGRLSAELCDAVTGRSDSLQVLRELEAAGLFIRALDAEQRWFKYHTLFSEFLAEQLLEQEPEAGARIHKAAAEWFASHQLHEPTLHHALAVRDYDLAARTLDQWAEHLIPAAHLVTVERWIDRLPLDVIAQHPTLVVRAAYAMTFLRRHAKLAPLRTMLEALEQDEQPKTLGGPHVVLSMVRVLLDDLPASEASAQRVDVQAVSDSAFEAFELGAAANLLAYAAQTRGEFELARSLLMVARAHGERADAAFSWGYSIGTMGVNLILRGQLREALDHLKQGIADPRIGLDDSVASAALLAALIHALYEANELDAAKTQFTQFGDVHDAALHDYLSLAYVARARIHDSDGDPAQASELLDAADAIGYSSNWPRLTRQIGWERVRRALVRGELDRAHSIASRIPRQDSDEPEGWLRFAEDTNDELIGRTRMAIHDGRPRDALRRIEQALPLAEAQERVARQIKLLILQALAHDAAQDSEAARGALLSALTLAQAGGFLRSFLDEGERATALLDGLRSHRQVMKSASLRQHLDLVLVASGHQKNRSDALEGSAFEPLDPLTEREEEIVSLLAAGASNKVMAKQLFVSENTVKFHLKNIYSKLGVNSRVQAVGAARAMGLLD